VVAQLGLIAAQVTMGNVPCTGVTVKDVAVPDDCEACAARVRAAVRNLLAFESLAAELQ
jgi:hypothetical protein